MSECRRAGGRETTFTLVSFTRRTMVVAAMAFRRRTTVVGFRHKMTVVGLQQ